MHRLAILLLSLASFCQAADITIKVPPAPIQPNEFVMLEVTGITEDQLKTTKFTLTPANGVRFFPMKSWDNVPYLFFQTPKPGRYEILLSINKFRTDLDAGLDGAKSAKIDATLLNDLQVVVTKVGAKYPAKAGQAIVEVAGDPIPPPKPPEPPTPVTQGTVFTVIIRQVDTLTPDQSRTLSDLRQWTDQQPGEKVAHWEFPPGAEGPDGSPDPKVSAFVSHIPAGKTQPYVFICRANQSGKSTVLWHAELPPSAEPIIAKIQEVSR